MGIIFIICGAILRWSLPSLFWPNGSVSWDPKAAAVVFLRPDVLRYQAACELADLVILAGILVCVGDYYFGKRAKKAPAKQGLESESAGA